MADVWGVATGVGDPLYDEWTNGTNLFASDDAYATATVVNKLEDTDGYSWFLPVAAGQYLVIDAIHGEIEAKTSVISGLGRVTLGLSLSWDGGTSWTSTYSAIWAFADGETTKTVAVLVTGDRKTWGRNWTLDELDSGVFRCRMKVVKLDATTTVYVDRLRIGLDFHAEAHAGGCGCVTGDTEIAAAY